MWSAPRGGHCHAREQEEPGSTFGGSWSDFAGTGSSFACCGLKPNRSPSYARLCSRHKGLKSRRARGGADGCSPRSFGLRSRLARGVARLRGEAAEAIGYSASSKARHFGSQSYANQLEVRIAENAEIERQRRGRRERTEEQAVPGRSSGLLESLLLPVLRSAFAALGKLISWSLSLQLKRRLRERRVAARIRESGLFDDEFYLVSARRRLSRSEIRSCITFVMEGELRDPYAAFDTGFYLETYPDVRALGVNPLDHYVQHGSSEGRRHTLSSIRVLLRGLSGRRRVGRATAAALDVRRGRRPSSDRATTDGSPPRRLARLKPRLRVR